MFIAFVKLVEKLQKKLIVTYRVKNLCNYAPNIIVKSLNQTIVTGGDKLGLPLYN